MTLINSDFSNLVQDVVKHIPKGKVMTYGQIASLCGHPDAARVVGGIAHFGDPDIPWHRVVNSKGGLARGYPGGRLGHGDVLGAEGVKINNYALDLKQYLFKPEN